MDTIQVTRFSAFFLSIHLVSCLLEVDGGSLKLSSSNTHHRKTIKTEYGDIYDCVDIYKQPALRHPLLRDHKIQTRPTFSQQREVSEGSPNNVKLGLKEECPPGTVPIRRTTKKERLQSNAFFRTQFQRSYVANGSNGPEWRVGIYTELTENRYIEGGGYVSTHNPIVDKGQISSSVISMEDGLDDSYSAFIRVGWMVNPDLFNGENHTHLYAVWGQVINGTKQGCMNALCPGFVQVSPTIPIDMVIDQISSGHEADGFVYINVGVARDAFPEKDWWILYGHGNDLENYESVGYYPDDLFPMIKAGFQQQLWGGYVYSKTPTLPTMGNGVAGEQGAHFRKVWSTPSGNDATISPRVSGTDQDNAAIGLQQSACYKAGDNSYKGSDFWGYSFWFGGAGGDVQKCPK